VDRVLVLGSSGSGKSTFTRALAERTGLPSVSLDALFWQPGWVEPPREAFEARVREAIAAPRWIIDGNFLTHGLGAERIARADTIVWFDLPTWVCLTGVVVRIATGYGRVRSEMAPGCAERFELAFLDYVRTFRAKQRPKIARALALARPDQRVHVFMTRRAAWDWLGTSVPSPP